MATVGAAIVYSVGLRPDPLLTALAVGRVDISARRPGYCALQPFGPVHDRTALQGFSNLSMNAVGALGGALAGLVLSAVGYSGLGLAMTLVGVLVAWSTLRAARGRRGVSR